jgi:putative aminopeptidase
MRSLVSLEGRGLITSFLSSRRLPPVRCIALAASTALSAAGAGEARGQQSLNPLVARLVSLSAVTGYEHAAIDTVLRLLPDARRDRFGNARLALGGGKARRLLVCPLDEPGYVVGNLQENGYLTLRRVPGRESRLFDQQIEGQRVTIQGSRGDVPGVVAVRSIHLTRGREPLGEAPFSVDDAYVDVGTDSRSETTRLGVRVLAPVTLTKRAHIYGNGLLAGPMAGRRTACAAMLLAIREAMLRKGLIPPLVAAVVVEQELSQRGLAGLATRDGPFDETLVVDGRPGTPGTIQRAAGSDASSRYRNLGRIAQWSLPVRYVGTAVETVSLTDADSLRRALGRWIGGDQ